MRAAGGAPHSLETPPTRAPHPHPHRDTGVLLHCLQLRLTPELPADHTLPGWAAGTQCPALVPVTSLCPPPGLALTGVICAVATAGLWSAPRGSCPGRGGVWVDPRPHGPGLRPRQQRHLESGWRVPSRAWAVSALGTDGGTGHFCWAGDSRVGPWCLPAPGVYRGVWGRHRQEIVLESELLAGDD